MHVTDLLSFDVIQLNVKITWALEIERRMQFKRHTIFYHKWFPFSFLLRIFVSLKSEEIMQLTLTMILKNIVLKRVMRVDDRDAFGWHKTIVAFCHVCTLVSLHIPMHSITNEITYQIPVLHSMAISFPSWEISKYGIYCSENLR